MVYIFDIDGTITNEGKFLQNVAPRFLEKKFKRKFKIVNEDATNINEIFDLSSFFMSLGYSEKKCAREIELITKEITKKTYFKYMLSKIRDDYMKFNAELLANGDKVYFVTLRGVIGKDTEGKLQTFLRKKIVPLLNSMQFKLNGIKSNQVFFAKTEEEKLKIIEMLDGDVYFDDKEELLDRATNSKNDLQKILVTNKEISGNEKYPTINDYKNVKEKIILKKKNNHFKVKKLTIYQSETWKKICNDTMRLFGGPYFFIKNKPIVRQSSISSQEKGKVVLSNHRHKLDPVLISLTSKNTIFWGALLRMFQGKENLFSSTKSKLKCNVSAGFIIAAGATPIARETDEDYKRVNLNSTKKFLEYNKYGIDIGVFPEGTLNRNPKEKNILSLKSDMFFKLSKRNGILQPVAITWIGKEYNISNKVIISYMPPINTTKRSVEEISRIWKENVNKELEESNKLLEKIKKINESTAFDKQEKIKVLIKRFENNQTVFF